MQTGLSNQYENPLLENVNHQLLQNQSFLYEENQKLQKDVAKLSKQLNHLKTSNVNPELFEALKKEKNNLLELNHTLNNKIKILRSPPAAITQLELQKEHREKHDLMKTVHDLDEILQKVKNFDKPSIKESPAGGNVSLVVEIMRKKLDESEQKREELKETIRKLCSNDEKYTLREEISDMKQLITDLEVENTKLKYDSEQITEDIETYKKQLHDATEEAKAALKKTYQLEEDKDKLKDQISDLETEKISLKKEMIEK